MPNSNLNSHFISETKIDEKDEKDEKALQKYCMVVYHEGWISDKEIYIHCKGFPHKKLGNPRVAPGTL